MYGQFDVDRRLGPFYEQLGFTVHPPRAWLDIPVREAGTGGIRIPPMPDEQWFVRYFKGSPPPGGPKIDATVVTGRTDSSARVQAEAADPVAPPDAPRIRWWTPWRRMRPQGDREGAI
jgi:hypothetical protein